LIREAPNKPVPLQAVQHIRKMRGGSQAHLIRASDKNLYIVKFQNNPQHVRVLVNEYLGTSVGRVLHLPMPEVRIMEVSEWLIKNTPELKIDVSPRSVSTANGIAGSCPWRIHVEQLLNQLHVAPRAIASMPVSGTFPIRRCEVPLPAIPSTQM
jgi:hypothetical protein